MLPDGGPGNIGWPFGFFVPAEGAFTDSEVNTRWNMGIGSYKGLILDILFWYVISCIITYLCSKPKR